MECNIKTIEIPCTKEQLFDESWLFNNIPWINHDNEQAKLIFSETLMFYCIDKGNSIKDVMFDNILVSAFHGFSGNSYDFNFFHGDEQVYYCSDISGCHFDVKELLIKIIRSENKKTLWRKELIIESEKRITILKKILKQYD